MNGTTINPYDAPQVISTKVILSAPISFVQIERAPEEIVSISEFATKGHIYQVCQSSLVRIASLEICVRLAVIIMGLALVCGGYSTNEGMLGFFVMGLSFFKRIEPIPIHVKTIFHQGSDTSWVATNECLELKDSSSHLRYAWEYFDGCAIKRRYAILYSSETAPMLFSSTNCSSGEEWERFVEFIEQRVPVWDVSTVWLPFPMLRTLSATEASLRLLWNMLFPRERK